ncbi:hypothetical protein K474DRAFT_75058 [Panus rudis PR-1116 ss-1]|nr:hypothetical protein K474DRAFT_75058 [Panus rudis PR-1116 ss-1]
MYIPPRPHAGDVAWYWRYSDDGTFSCRYLVYIWAKRRDRHAIDWFIDEATGSPAGTDSEQLFQSYLVEDHLLSRANDDIQVISFLFRRHEILEKHKELHACVRAIISRCHESEITIASLCPLITEFVRKLDQHVDREIATEIVTEDLLDTQQGREVIEEVVRGLEAPLRNHICDKLDKVARGSPPQSSYGDMVAYEIDEWFRANQPANWRV